ncbi:MAG: polysaccharide biosynthesis protein [Acidobacteria bacterium]|nr:MAG: polysaccharide biosynthesis protein [Acidobacteriota bacterium]REJ98320.1 MAG: polysaccharide biosynthesis protein [Acidobacteriota bacterium]REK17064.1 MAG: polysaccharide biosynthesis protein [Acidobacteriota bacterium]REK42974.1 MAG: polysaccharide biosynthesis protein [Acidobacteriota bacterium]
MKVETRLEDRYWYLRRPVQLLADVTILGAAFYFAYLLRFDFNIPENYQGYAINQLPFVVLIQFASLMFVGAYSIIWRYISLEDIKSFLKAALISSIILLVIRLVFVAEEVTVWQVPLSVTLMSTIFGYSGLLALRVLRRFIYEVSEKRGFSLAKRRIKQKPTLIVGAGRIGAALAKEMVGRVDAELDIRGFVDDDRRKQGGSVNSIKVLGSTLDLARLVDELQIEEVVLAMGEAKGKDIRRILDICRSIPIKAQIVPSLNEIAHGRVNVSRIRDVQIEDLLGREPVKLDDANLKEFLRDKVVMVTGAGGSIGSELVRQITGYEPARILLVERAEYFLFNIERELEKDFPGIENSALLADIGDEKRMREIFEEFRPEVIFHAAAHKHVPLMEKNAIEAVKNNVLATKLVGGLAGEYGAKDFVLISTDKAVNPTSVMGASKRFAELVIQSLNRQHETNYVAVRFGNVLGSAGSVVPIFKEQIERGGPVTVTDREMTRYFMTIPEASQLVLQAAALGRGGEIFILDMGEPVRILDLAEDMIRLSGLEPYEEIDIRFTGKRDGEKLFEELELTGEELLKTKHPKIFIGRLATYTDKEVEEIIAEINGAIGRSNPDLVRELISEKLPESSIGLASPAEEPGEPEKESFFPHTNELGTAGNQ